MQSWADLGLQLWPLRYIPRKRKEYLEKHAQGISQLPLRQRLWHRYGFWLCQVGRHEAKSAGINLRLVISQNYISLLKAADKAFGTNLLRRHARSLRKQREQAKAAGS